MDLISSIKNKARGLKLGVVLPEASDIRVLKAAETIAKEELAGRVVLLGSPSQIAVLAEKERVDLSGVEIIDHVNSPDFNRYAELYYNLRKEKGMTIEESKDTMRDPTFYGMCMVREKDIDTLVSGSLATTAHVLRATIQIIGMDAGSRTVSSCFLMIVPNSTFGYGGAFLFADAGCVPDPNAEQLADIAINTGRTARVVFGEEPKIARRSFSTKGSAHHRSVDKVIRAAAIAHEKAPDLYIEGELQLDSAIVPEIAEKKLSDSPVAGHANVLIFPDLNSGNICYKITERLANAAAYGPLVQGVNIPVSDLSRGCTSVDIVNTTAVTLLRVGEHNERTGN